MNDTHNTRHSGRVLHNTAALQRATGTLALCLDESARREDASLSEHLPYLRDIIVQATLFGLAYQQGERRDAAADHDTGSDHGQLNGGEADD